MVKRVDMLNSDLARMASELEEQQKALREERQLKADATQKLVQLQHELNEAKSDANALKQVSHSSAPFRKKLRSK
uniref:Uncharacterized protein n=1 Tax=Parascaris equorum TaxID=6256 RepID=A0A914S2H0_PAREQ